MKKYILLLLALTLFVNISEARRRPTTPVESVTFGSSRVDYFMKEPQSPFQVMFLSDTHFTVEDERGREYYDYTRRMGGWAVEPENYGKTNGREAALLASLEKARKERVELVILGGDILNFPSLASAEWLRRTMDSSGLKWAYIAGNHDWHYEGEEGSADSLRQKWTASNLNTLYQDKNPMYYARVIRGINFVMIDNSTNEISPVQLAFLKAEQAKGHPIILSVHVPLYLPGHNTDYGCGNPQWNTANDTYYEIERRQPWPNEGHTRTTYDFCKAVWDSPLVIGIFAGHTHEAAVDIHNNIPQFVLGANYNGADYLIRFQSDQQ